MKREWLHSCFFIWIGPTMSTSVRATTRSITFWTHLGNPQCLVVTLYFTFDDKSQLLWFGFPVTIVTNSPALNLLYSVSVIGASSVITTGSSLHASWWVGCKISAFFACPTRSILWFKTKYFFSSLIWEENRLLDRPATLALNFGFELMRHAPSVSMRTLTQSNFHELALQVISH